MRTLMVIAACLTVWYGDAQIMNPSTRIRLTENHKISRTEEQSPYQPLMLMITEESVIDDLLSFGVIIYGRRDDILLTSVPREVLKEVLALDGIVNAEASGDMSSVLNRARPFGRVDAVQSGQSPLTMSYDGSGVIAGFSDIGFDSKHIAFQGRIGAIYDYNAFDGIERKAITKEEIEAWTTDNPKEFHATHVANILAGNYRGNEYYGVATGAEIVATTSDLSDVGILSGVERIIEYAKNNNKPAVINLSLANYMGPHDGTDLFCQYLSRCSDDAVICISAGNSATTKGYASQEIKDDKAITEVTVNSQLTWNGFDVMGMTEFWSENNTPFEARIEVFDTDTKEIVYTSEWKKGNDSILIDVSDTQWAKYMSGEIMLVTGWSNLNNRYCASVAYDTHTEPVAANSGGKWSRYYNCIAIKGIEGSGDIHVDIYADACTSYISRATVETSPMFSSRGSINDLCTAEGVIAVGACSSRNTAPSLSGPEQRWNFEIDQIADFSSYSDVSTIKPLPHISAPGNYVVSAVSSQFLQNVHTMDYLLVCVDYVDGTPYYWMAECGTSMSSPYTAGVIAQWLQIDPTLTSQHIIEILQATALTDYPDIDNPAWGAGCVNAMAGIEKVIASLPFTTDTTHPIVRVTEDRRIEVTDVSGKRYKFELWDISGKMIDSATSLRPGIYIVKAESEHIIKVAVR